MSNIILPATALNTFGYMEPSDILLLFVCYAIANRVWSFSYYVNGEYTVEPNTVNHLTMRCYNSCRQEWDRPRICPHQNGSIWTYQIQCILDTNTAAIIPAWLEVLLEVGGFLAIFLRLFALFLRWSHCKLQRIDWDAVKRHTVTFDRSE